MTIETFEQKVDRIVEYAERMKRKNKEVRIFKDDNRLSVLIPETIDDNMYRAIIKNVLRNGGKTIETDVRNIGFSEYTPLVNVEISDSRGNQYSTKLHSDATMTRTGKGPDAVEYFLEGEHRSPLRNMQAIKGRITRTILDML